MEIVENILATIYSYYLFYRVHITPDSFINFIRSSLLEMNKNIFSGVLTVEFVLNILKAYDVRSRWRQGDILRRILFIYFNKKIFLL